MTWLHENRLALLRRTRALLAQGWTQRVWARRAPDGVPLAPNDPRAGCWCLTGAMRKALDEAKPTASALRGWAGPTDYLCALLSFRGYDDAHDWNDDERRTQRSVLARVDKAIAQIEALKWALK